MMTTPKDLAINSIVLAFSGFVFTLAGMGAAHVGVSFKAAALAGAMTAGLRVSLYLLRERGFDGPDDLTPNDKE